MLQCELPGSIGMPAPACGTGVGAAVAGAGTRQCRTPWEAPSSGREGGRGGKPRPLAPDGRQVQGMTRVRSGLGSGHRRARPSRSCVADSCHRHSDSEESRSGVAPGMHSTRKITAITEERAGIRPRRAPSAVSVDAGVPPGASPGSPLPARRRGPDTTRRSPRWSEEADWGGCFAPPARLGGGVTVEGVSSPSRLDGTIATCAGLVNTSSARLSFTGFVALPGSSMGSLRHRGTVPSSGACSHHAHGRRAMCAGRVDRY